VRYTQIYDGEWYKPKTLRGHRMVCCDCGLVHVMDFVIAKHGRGHTVLIRSVRDKRATAARRKRHGLSTIPRKKMTGVGDAPSQKGVKDTKNFQVGGKQ